MDVKKKTTEDLLNLRLVYIGRVQGLEIANGIMETYFSGVMTRADYKILDELDETNRIKDEIEDELLERLKQ